MIKNFQNKIVSERSQQIIDSLEKIYRNCSQDIVIAKKEKESLCHIFPNYINEKHVDFF